MRSENTHRLFLHLRKGWEPFLTEARFANGWPTWVECAVRKLAYKIEYEENAVGWTEAPDTMRGLAE